jgi:hypothetical protein
MQAAAKRYLSDFPFASVLGHSGRVGALSHQAHVSEAGTGLTSLDDESCLILVIM